MTRISNVFVVHGRISVKVKELVKTGMKKHVYKGLLKRRKRLMKCLKKLAFLAYKRGYSYSSILCT